MRRLITSIEQLEAHYAKPGEASLIKVADRLTDDYRAWVFASRFCVLSTVGPQGVDASPRGDDGPVARELDPHHLAIPDWRGNNRLDSLRNIVQDGRASLMFFLRGRDNVVRMNGAARLSCDEDLISMFSRGRHRPKTVIEFEISEIYFQCARALMRSSFWSGALDGQGLPSLGTVMRNLSAGQFDGAAYDNDWLGRATATMWSDPE